MANETLIKGTSTNQTNLCPSLPPDYPSIVWNINFIAYNIGAPVYFFLAISGHGLLLLAYVKQLKSQKTYMYQVYCAASRTVETVSRTLYEITMPVLIYSDNIRLNSIQESLIRNYGFVWFSSHISVPLTNSLITTSLLLSVAMAADRVYALQKPMAYKGLRHERNRGIALALSLLVAFGASAFDVKRPLMSETADEEGRYLIRINIEYMSQLLVKVLALVRVAIQAVAVIALAILSAYLCYLYRTRFVNVKTQMLDTGAQKRTKDDEKTLVLLTAIECSLTVISFCVTMLYYAVIYVYPQFYQCWHNLVTPLHDLGRMLMDVSNFYVIVGISGRFRRMIKPLVCPCLAKNQVEVIAQAPGRGPDAVVSL